MPYRRFSPKRDICSPRSEDKATTNHRSHGRSVATAPMSAVNSAATAPAPTVAIAPVQYGKDERPPLTLTPQQPFLGRGLRTDKRTAIGGGVLSKSPITSPAWGGFRSATRRSIATSAVTSARAGRSTSTCAALASGDVSVTGTTIAADGSPASA